MGMEVFPMGVHTTQSPGVSLETSNIVSFSRLSETSPDRPARARECAALCGPVLHGILAHNVAQTAVEFDYDSLWEKRMESQLEAPALLDLFKRDVRVLEFCCRELQDHVLEKKAEALLQECRNCIADLELELQLRLHEDRMQEYPEAVKEADSFLQLVATRIDVGSNRLKNFVGSFYGLMATRSLDLVD